MGSSRDARHDDASHPFLVIVPTQIAGSGRTNMEITIIFKIAAVGIIVTVLGQVLKQSGRDEQAFLLGLVGLVIVLFWVIPYISELFEAMEALFLIG